MFAPSRALAGWRCVGRLRRIGLVALLLQEQFEFFRPFSWRMLDDEELIAVFGGAVLAAVFGFIDDRWQIRARWQFVFQVVLALFAIGLGLSILAINNPLDFLGFLRRGHARPSPASAPA